MSKIKDRMLQIQEIVSNYMENNSDWWEDDVVDYVMEKIPTATSDEIRDAIEFMNEEMEWKLAMEDNPND